MDPIRNYDDFCTQLLEAGFSIGAENDEGVFSLGSRFDKGIRWHTDDPETDPWVWRMRVLEEREDIAYAKLFFGKSGYITKDWYPQFLAARRGGTSFEEAYENGTISYMAKRIYSVVKEEISLPLHLIKERAGISREDKSKFDRALAELQSRMFLTMCGYQQKRGQSGEGYGWFSTVFCATESFFEPGVFDRAGQLETEQAAGAIREQVFALNPRANPKKVEKFIYGR